MDVTVSIVSYNTRPILKDCLEALFDSRPRCEMEAVVSDNGSEDGSVEMVKSLFPRCRVIENRANLGFSRGSNVVLKSARGRYTLFLNSDAMVQTGAVDELVSFMDSRPEAVLAGPRLLNRDGSVQQSCYNFPDLMALSADNFFVNELFPRNRLTGGYKYWAHDREREVEWISGACMMGRTRELNELGGFDENFFMYGEETELCLRVRKAGWKVLFTPSASVVHLGGGSSERGADEFREIVYVSNDYYYRKHYGGFYNFLTKMIWLKSSLLKWPIITLAMLFRPRKSGKLDAARRYHARRIKYFLGPRLWRKLY